MTDFRFGLWYEKKVLFVANIDGHINAFHLPYLKWFQGQGWETYVASNSGETILSGNGNSETAPTPADGQDLGADIIPYCDHKYNIDIQRSPFDKRNLRAYHQLKQLLKENHFDLIHCHTPMGGVLARLAARKARRSGTKVLYTAHGFHFYKGSPKSGWFIYYPFEKALSRITDGLITINTEDYEIAKKKMHAKHTFFTHGVGYDDTRFYPHTKEEKQQLRAEYSYNPDDILLIYVAELNENKNQGLLLQVLKLLLSDDGHSNTRLLLVGSDSIDGEYQRLAQKLGIMNSVDFLGRRDDVDRLLPMCDIALSSSLREGLPVNVMEAMGCGIPIVALSNRGTSELVKDGATGYLIKPNATRSENDQIVLAFVKQISKAINDSNLCNHMSIKSIDSISQYSLAEVEHEMQVIYKLIMIG